MTRQQLVEFILVETGLDPLYEPGDELGWELVMPMVSYIEGLRRCRYLAHIIGEECFVVDRFTGEVPAHHKGGEKLEVVIKTVYDFLSWYRVTGSSLPDPEPQPPAEEAGITGAPRIF